MSAGYTIRNTGATVQLAINNVLGTPYRSFVGVPKIGRFALVRLRYDF
jgi:outer membrane receptor protein involved in Fe transport